MRKAILVSILLLAMSVLGVARVQSSTVLEASTNSMSGRALPDAGGPRRAVGLWLLAMTATAVVLRTRSSRATR